MLKVKLDWHSNCQRCGTEIVSDFLDDRSPPLKCPWCGAECDAGQDSASRRLKRSLAKAACELEAKANSTAAV